MIPMTTALLLSLVLTAPVPEAGTVVQTGSISGSAGPPQLQDVVLNQFDDLGGLRTLTSVVIDQFSSVIGGGTGNGSGIKTKCFAQLTCDLSLTGNLLTTTQPTIDFTYPNTSNSSFTLFDNDSEQASLVPPSLAPWTGTGTITLDALTEFVVTEKPRNTVFFGAGGGIDYTVTYHFTEVVVSYCTAGTSSSGCQATLGATGTSSASAATGFSVNATGVEGGKDGLYFYGSNGRQANSWGNGTSLQCVVPPVRRAGILTGAGTPGACDGVFAQDLNARWTANPSHNPGAGAVVQLQLWYRDPQNTSNQTTSLSEGLEFTVQP